MNFASPPKTGAIGVLAMLNFIALPPTAVPTRLTQPEYEKFVTYATSTGQVCVEGNPIAEIRRISGLTFDQLARMFAVARRTVHLWMSGQRMLPAKQEQVQRILATMRRVDRGASDLTRAALLGDGAKILDLIANGELSAVEGLLGAGPVKHHPLPPTSRRPRAEQPSPADLVQATQDGPHPAVHGGKRIKSMKATRIPRGK
jgi:DNA-binding transcriptional regulator YiaG